MNRTQTKDAGMSTETLPRDDTVTGLSTIEGIDLDATVACEHSRHRQRHFANQPAWARVRCVRRCCDGGGTDYLLCAEGWLRMGTNGIRCTECNRVSPRDHIVTVLHVL